MNTTRDKLLEILKTFQDKKIGFTSGTFDLLHDGHVAYLAEAKKRCDILIVGVNSDLSVKTYKDSSRPIVPEESRAAVLNGLKSVDYVFIFNETNNHENINLLKPNFYFKAGDYDKASLSSAPLVESYGGQVIILPFVSGFSSTSIINKIIDTNLNLFVSLPAKTPAPALFLDRDGTVNELVEYLHEPKKLKIIPGAFDAIKHFQNLGFKIVIVTNQPGINFGYYTKEDLFAVNKEIMKQAHKAGIGIDKIYFCPHVKTENCSCRKPSPGMLLRAEEELNIIMEKSIMVGDMLGDVEAGKAAGCGKTVLVRSGHKNDGDSFTDNNQPDYVLDSLAELVKVV